MNRLASIIVVGVLLSPTIGYAATVDSITKVVSDYEQFNRWVDPVGAG